ncbi:hypothetical protein EYB53_015210 [Candidatus Chloroploca sp. M-50]|uniref:Uncharacterized protein n=1 Tax=Candidatus Chloroploca mongolica TaxID=2528176 RepID=A0ABS4DC88_9CHLR|nr:hypothetical protein [Candidatus Chloroploca mongolica]MBP1467062.1 hypothetical protein [Candidatus Chloroploca mongolica]
MKTRKIRGMRDVMTSRGSGGRSVPPTREKILAEQARLEHKRAMLERELAMWSENQRQTAERLQEVLDRLEVLMEATAPVPAPEAEAKALRPNRNRVARDDESDDDSLTEWHAIVLEY